MLWRDVVVVRRSHHWVAVSQSVSRCTILEAAVLVVLTGEITIIGTRRVRICIPVELRALLHLVYLPDRLAIHPGKLISVSVRLIGNSCGCWFLWIYLIGWLRNRGRSSGWLKPSTQSIKSQIGLARLIELVNFWLLTANNDHICLLLMQNNLMLQ